MAHHEVAEFGQHNAEAVDLLDKQPIGINRLAGREFADNVICLVRVRLHLDELDFGGVPARRKRTGRRV